MNRNFRAAALAVTLGFSLSAQAAEVPSTAYEFLVARMAAESGDYRNALSTLDELIKADPANVTLLFERASLLADMGDDRRAEQELRKIVRSNPDFFDAQRLLGRILYEGSRGEVARVEEALGHLHAAFKLEPDDLGTGMVVAQVYAATRRLAEAEQVYATLVERAPTNRLVNFQYAQVLTQLGRAKEAQPYLERAVEVDPTYRPAVTQLLDIYTEANEFEKAARLLDPLIEDDPTNLDLQRQQSVYWLRARQPEKAAERLNPLVKAQPDHERTRFYLAEALADQGKHAEAEPILRELITANPQNEDYLTSFALNQLAQKKYDEATRVFTGILALPALQNNLAALARTQLAAIEYERKNYDAAIERALPAVTWGDRLNGQAVNIAVEAYAKQKKYDAALELIQRLQKDGREEEPLLVSRRIEMLIAAGRLEDANQYSAPFLKKDLRTATLVAEAYARSDKYAEAAAMLSPLVRTNPDNIDLLFQVGAFQERGGRHKDAEVSFLAVLAKNPNHAPTLNYLGYMWADRGENLERAAEMLVKAVGQDPDNGAYVDSLGWAYFRLGKLELAEKHLRDAVRLVPDDATVRQHLAEVLSRRGDVKKAIEEYKLALTLSPDAAEEATIKAKLAELEKKGR